MSDSIDDLARAYLLDRKSQGLLRRRRSFTPIDATHVEVDGRRLVNFCSNDYLGMAWDDRVRRAMRSSPSCGAGAAPLISGRTRYHALAEKRIAYIKRVESAVLLPSGYQANHAAVQAIYTVVSAAGLKPKFIIDKLVHASIIDAIHGVIDSRDQLRSYPHNDVAKLKTMLEKTEPGEMPVVVTESIFSMDGDRGKVDAIASLKQQHRFLLMVDEAHDVCVPLGGTRPAIDIGVMTLSKSVGVCGGAVIGSKMVVRTVVNAGRAYLYSTALPTAMARAICASLDRLNGSIGELKVFELHKNMHHLEEGLSLVNITGVRVDSAIVPLIIGDAQRALDISRSLEDAGFLVMAVRPPTVPRGTARLRITLSSEHTDKQIRKLCYALSTAGLRYSHAGPLPPAEPTNPESTD
jgi:8-amino-7-oxononanoate synthase